ncbi:hypothetical protein HKD37_14G040789 [Glycine soja]
MIYTKKNGNKKKYGSRNLPIMWPRFLLRNQVNQSSPRPRGPHLPRREPLLVPLLVPLLPGPQANLQAMRPLP